MKKILLSIHPEYVEKIISGEKRYEFRKVKARLRPDIIIIYSTSPVSQIIGEAEVEDVLVGTPEKVWKITSMHSGVDPTFFSEYYHNKKEAVAYQLKNVTVYTEPKELKDYGLNVAPQSFAYI
ncbi:ASCH domain-containing protein [Amphibacillus sediminis]|uniref:ASCH domain-containing protein n=1 Tax=Amphibacillus sediminis TaxID=360185 RepID=UPI00082F24F0|nr:ASCH domain-containing protein [Amphibacillus sediminis]